MADWLNELEPAAGDSWLDELENPPTPLDNGEDPADRPVAPGVYSKSSLADMVGGVFEVGATIGSSIVAEPLSGLAGIAGAVLPGEEGQGAEWVESAQEALTYQPRTEAGQEMLSDVGEALAPVGEAMVEAESFLGEEALETTGSPAVAAAAHTVPTAMIELLGLGIIKKVTKNYDVALKAAELKEVRPGMTAADVAEELLEPEDMDYLTITDRLKRGQTQEVAEQVKPDMQILADAEKLGLDLNPSHYSTSEAYQRVEQAFKSNPATDLAAREAEAITALGEKADELIKKTGGEVDRSLLDEEIGNQMRSTISDLEMEADKLYKIVREEIPKATKVNPRASRAYIDARLEELGGDASLLSTAERKLQRTLDRELPPTYDAIDTLRRNIGDAYKRQGPFKDEASGTLDQVYKALLTDQQNLATARGAGETFDAARKLVADRKRIEDNAIALMGRDLNKSILPKLTSAAGGITKGDVQQFKNLMEALPENQRARAAATLLNDLFTMGARRRNASIGSGFADAYEALQRHSGVKAELFKYLPKKSQDTFDAIGRVSQGIYQAKRLENTSRTARDILQALEASTLPDKLVKGLGTLARWTPGLPSAIGEAATVHARRAAKRTEKATELMNSPSFMNAVQTAMEGRVKEADMMLKRSKAWKQWRKTLGSQEAKLLAAVGPIAYLTRPAEELMLRQESVAPEHGQRTEAEAEAGLQQQQRIEAERIHAQQMMQPAVR